MLLTRKASSQAAPQSRLARAATGAMAKTMDRRTFLKRSGLAIGALAALGDLPLGGIRKAEAGPPLPAGATITTRKNLCTHCSVGCSVIAEVANGIWIGQEPVYDSPINRGSHCCRPSSPSCANASRRFRS